MAKGLSTILGTILLIGIAVAAGTSIFNIANQFSIVGFSKTEYGVIDASLTKSGNKECFLHVKLINTGTEPIVSTKLEIHTDKNGTLTIRDSELPANIMKSIDPGDTITFDSTVFTNSTGILPFFNNCVAWNNCQTYTMDVLGNATDSSRTVTSHILPCKESDKI
ncbi:MAG: archaellin/type IV pilin N-terminal domain-containing protein [Nitrososphaerales archaeon]